MNNFFIFIHPSSDGAYYGMAMSVWVSVRACVRLSIWVSVRPFSALFPTSFDILSWNFAYDFVSKYYRSSVVTLRQLLKKLCPFWDLENTWNTQFSALFSYMLWHIKLNFAYDFFYCSTTNQVKFECRQFASIFVAVMPILELRTQEIRSFPHFSSTCFDILSRNFAYDFFFTVLLLYYRSSTSVVNLRQFL